MKTLYVTLKGGLGNQLFQYAAALYMKNMYGFDRVICDTSWLEAYQDVPGITPRQFELAPLITTPRTRWPTRSTGYPASAIMLPEECTEITEGILHDNYRISGYFQQNRYVTDRIRWKLQEIGIAPLKMKMFDKYPELRGDCVSVHIRRGDYVTNPSANAYHGVLPPSYYQEAVERAAREFYDPCICVFTDDVKHVRENIGVYIPDRFVNDSVFNTDALDTLACMYWCDAHVIANSSFSWWGAKLGNPEAQVIYPKQWNRNSQVPEGLMPADWIGI
jgi:hypothetical protein